MRTPSQQNSMMQRITLALSFLATLAAAQTNCSQSSVSLLPTIGTGRIPSLHYAWLVQADEDSSNSTTVTTTIEDETAATLCVDGCSRLVYAESTWQPHYDEEEEASGLELQSGDSTTMITAKRFGKAEFDCEPLECGEDEVLVEAYVHIQNGGSVAIQAADTVLTETEGLAYHQSCQVASACTTMCFASTGDSLPLYATGRVIVDGAIVFDKDLEVFDCQDGESAVQVGSCSEAELFNQCEQSLLTVELSTDENGPYSPYGVSWGIEQDGVKSSLSPPNDSNGYESNVVFKESYCISKLECTDFFIDNQYDDATFQVALLLDGEELEVTSSEKGTASQALTECSSNQETERAADEEDNKLSGGAIAGIVIGVVFCCCCAIFAAYVNEEYS